MWSLNESIIPYSTRSLYDLEKFTNFKEVKSNFEFYTNSEIYSTGLEFFDVPFLSESEAREALERFTNQKCYYSKEPIKKLLFSNFRSTNVYRYVLRTFTETRSTCNNFKPYFGTDDAKASNGISTSNPWDLYVEPDGLFKNQVIQLELPNTSYIEVCHECLSYGTRICNSCNGKGFKNCYNCYGTGHHRRIIDGKEINEICPNCSGIGTKRCGDCDSTGTIACSVCRGSGRLEWFTELKVTFQTYQDEYLNNSDQIVPDNLLRDCSSRITFSEQKKRVSAVSHHNLEISTASENLIKTHLSKYSNRRIIAQYHEISAIPITVCSYIWKKKLKCFKIYGLDQKVYSPNHPKICCCCNIV